MNEKQLEAFIVIAECGSFSQAEEILYTSKQALVKRINTLEQELEFTLFYRTSKGIELTEAGKDFYEGTKVTLKMQKELIERCKKKLSESKILRLNRIESHMLMDKITYRFLEKYPDIQLIMVMHHHKNERLRVAEGIADIGESPKIKEIDDLNLEYTKLIELPYVCLMTEDHPLSKYQKLRFPDLRQIPVTIDTRQFEPEQIEFLKIECSNLHWTLPVADQIQKAFEICQSGHIFLTPAYYSRFMHPLKVIPLDTSWTREYGLVTRKDSPEIVQNYLELAKQIYHTKSSER